MDEVAYAVHGFFFLPHQQPRTSDEPTVGSVDVSYLLSGHHYFGGMLTRSSRRPKWSGYLFDKTGDSELIDIEFDRGVLAFTQSYRRGGSEISYSFKLSDTGTWTGEWSSRVDGHGQANCQLTLVPRQLYMPV